MCDLSKGRRVYTFCNFVYLIKIQDRAQLYIGPEQVFIVKDLKIRRSLVSLLGLLKFVTKMVTVCLRTAKYATKTALSK